MSTPPTKRQRTLATSGIHKPFRSPLRHTTSNTTASSTAARPPTTSAPENAYTPLRSSALKRTFTAPLATPTTPSHSSVSHDPDIQAAQSQLRRLETQIRNLRAQNAVLSQALDLPASSEDVSSSSSSAKKSGRLQCLIAKWKAASQAAAEELWPDFEKRVKDNGGFGALKGGKGRDEGWMGDDGMEEKEEDWRDELGEELTVGEKERRRVERGRSGVREEEEEEVEEEEVGMKYMLGVLNIPLDTIGWHDQSQTWLP